MDDEQGSNNQMTSEQRDELRRRLELQLAETVEEDRKTAAQPVDAQA